MIEVKIRHFGVFRKFGDGSETRLHVPAGTTVTELKRRFVDHLVTLTSSEFDPRIIHETVFANDTRVLSPEDRMDESCTIATIPPVCGG